MTRLEDALGDNAHTLPQLLPGGRAVLFTAVGPSGGSDDARVVAQTLDSRERKTLVEHAMSGRFLPTGHLLYATTAGTIFAVPFDLARLKVTGEAVPVLSDVETGVWGGAAFLAVSDNGTLAFVRRSTRPRGILRVVDTSGRDLSPSLPLGTADLAKLGIVAQLDGVDPRGRRVAFTGRGPGISDIWVLDAQTGEPERLTLDPTEDECAAWSPDGRAVAYTSALAGTARRILMKSIETGKEPQLVRTWPGHVHLTSWSPDGKWLAAQEYTPTRGTDIWAIPVAGGDPIAITDAKADESDARFSPDGRWVAYVSDESGRPEAYVVSFPGLSARRQVSTDGATAVRWDPGSRALYYLQNGNLVAHTVSIGPAFSIGPSRRLFPTPAAAFEVLPGGRFILMERNPQPPDAPLQLIVNWFPELLAKFRR